mgnify:CR=1 FL=1
MLKYSNIVTIFLVQVSIRKFHNLENDHPRLVIPFFDEKDNMFAFQGRAFGKEEPKYITIILNSLKEKVYGLNRVDWKKTVYVVEGPIDSLFLDNCVATAQSDLRIKDRKGNVVLVPDNEPRNEQIVKQIEKFINNNYSVVLWPESIKEKDINDMVIAGYTKEQVQEIITDNTFSGAAAQLRFSEWRKIDA